MDPATIATNPSTLEPGTSTADGLHQVQLLDGAAVWALVEPEPWQELGFGRWLATVMAAKGWKQKDMAEALHVSRQYVGFLISGERAPTDALMAAAREL